MIQKKVFIVHGWDGYPEEGWFPWLKKELEANGFDVSVPQLPDAGHPRIHTWVPKLAEAVGVADEHTYFIGHSLGCQTIARFLEQLPEGTHIGGAIFVAGFFTRVTGLEDDPDAQALIQPWFETSIDMKRVKAHLPKSVAIFSDDDPWVPLDSQDDFRDRLDSEIVVEHHKGHFSGKRDGILQLPIVLEKLLGL